MKKTRLTRQQSQAQTRQRLLDAAQALFVKKGFGATSVEHITLAAGYSRGAFYSNFKSKTQLFIALLKRDHERIIAGLPAIVDHADAIEGEGARAGSDERAEMEAQLTQYYSRIYQDTKLYTLWLEARLHASRDPDFCTQLDAFQQDILVTIAQYVRSFAHRAGIDLPFPAEQLALGFMALCDGMGIYHLPGHSHADENNAQQILAHFLARVGLQR